MQSAAKPSFPMSMSRFRDGLRCEKLLWYRYHRKSLFLGPDAAAEAGLRAEVELQILARQCFEGGVAIRPGSARSRLDETQQRLAERIPLFSASFRSGRRHCSVDILRPQAEGDGWQLIAVSSQLEVEDGRIHELAFQSSCLRDAGVDVSQIVVMHPRRAYVRQGAVTADELFERSDVTERVRAVMDEDDVRFTELLESVFESEPEVALGAHCEVDGGCPLKSHCWERLPEHSVDELYAARARKYRFLEEGTLRIVDVDDDELSEKQLLQKRAIATGEPHHDMEQIHGWLELLEYPLWFLDFESVATAVPLIDGARPWQQLPIQVSLHRLNDIDGSVTQFEYLCENIDDPYTTLDGVLSQVRSEGSIVAFDAALQKRVLSNLADVVPEQRPHYLNLIARMVDLQEPFRSFATYHPEQHGSCSLPSLCRAITEHGDAPGSIADDGAASRAYQRALRLREDDDERGEIFDALRAYGAWKTAGMVELVRALQQIILEDAAAQSPTPANSPA